MDHNIAITIEKQSSMVMVANYISAENQNFKILHQNSKYAFVNPASNSAICVEEGPDGWKIESDSQQH